MALLWCDGFEHYGLDETNMLDGVYATASNVTLSEAFAANGIRSLLLNSSDTASSSGGLRFVLPTSKDKMGAIARFYFPNFPTDNVECGIFEFMTSSTTSGQIACVVDSNGRIGFYRGSQTTPSNAGMDGTLIGQTDPILVASAWNHIEIQVYIHDTLGWIRVAVNGVHRYALTEVDTKYNTDNIVSVRTCRYEVGTQSGDFYMDDLQLYDFVGDSAVDTDFVPTTDGSGVATGYIGELQCMYLPPDGDSATVADWTPSTGTDQFAVVDETTPDDLDYIYSTAAADTTELELTDLPEEITYIRGLQLLGRLSKSDAGAVMVTFGMNSAGTTDDAPERPVTVEPTYWWDFMNVDPDSGARWTRASLNAALFRIARTV